ncbi:class I SAM-dependent methyltransferase [Ferrovibrio sp.]|uniref:class I SAM-dependent methyltransferase n=1 Tax=Ferrovibrio sp. TaxID=1917215 RepID=UPI0035B1EECF
MSKGEVQYQSAIELIRGQGLQRMGFMSSWAFYDDPKRLAFTFARYKFAAKMLEGYDSVLEIGCADAFASRIVAQSVGKLTAVDFDPSFIASARETMSPRWPIELREHDLMTGPVEREAFDAIYSLDVLEHIPADSEDVFLTNMFAALRGHGVAIIGMPSLQSQAYASAHSKEGHVNCKDQRDFKRLMSRYFHSVFMFGMNDEVLHTGYHAMAHYNIALCSGLRHQ